MDTYSKRLGTGISLRDTNELISGPKTSLHSSYIGDVLSLPMSVNSRTSFKSPTFEHYTNIDCELFSRGFRLHYAVLAKSYSRNRHRKHDGIASNE